MAAYGRHFIVETPQGQRLQAVARGKRSEAVVGDQVLWSATLQGNETQAVLEKVVARRNLMHRRDRVRSKSFAANLDQVVMLVASQPLFSESQLARAMIAADAADIDVQVVLNKTDLPDAGLARVRLQPYLDMGIRVAEVSLRQAPEAALERLRPLLADRTTLLMGASGTGKSSVVNLLLPDAGLRTGELSQALQAGRHTTTHTCWHWLDSRRVGAVIDSPGFQEFGLQHIAASALAGHMPDFRLHLGGCRFANCLHIHEPDCSVNAAVAAGRISALRHRIYAEILRELSAPRW